LIFSHSKFLLIMVQLLSVGRAASRLAAGRGIEAGRQAGKGFGSM
jgi:hypothetical protein